MKKVLGISLFFILISQNLISQDFPWLDTELDTDDRIEALIDAMTLEEKVGQMVHASPAIERLNIPEYNWWNECLHGVARNGRATVFPQAIGMAATFDRDLIFRVATAISDEARVKYNVAQSIGNRGQYAGLTFWSPNVNIFRDPRWGRGQETYGEDPYLSGQLGVAFIKGIQGDHPKYLKAAAAAKHFAVHSGPEALRHEFNAIVSKKDLFETYLPAFEACVKEGKVEAIMGAYNKTNGESCCASPFLFQNVLEDMWGFEGHILSDCWGVSDIYKFHKMVDTPEEAASMAVRAGMDLNCGVSFNTLDNAVKQGLISEREIESSLEDLLATRFKLGLLDPPASNPFNEIDESVVESQKHVNLAREVAQKSMVLLKNENNALPLSKDIRSIILVGPQASSEDILIGNYYGLSGNLVSILEGITSAASLRTKVDYKYGQLPYQKNINSIDWVTGVAKNADACIAVFGISGLIEGEEGESIASENKGDREEIKLPQNQIDFIRKLGEGRTKPLILLVSSGSAIALPEVYDYVDAIIYTWYPGQQGGNAVADIIFGDVSPSGKLPFTVPYSVEDLPPYEDYNMAGRTYRYMTKEAQFPFGFGLGYSKISFDSIQLAQLKDYGDYRVSVKVKNEGSEYREEVVQLYISSPQSGLGQPLYALKDFKRIKLQPHEEEQVSFILDEEKLKTVNQEGQKVLLEGTYKIYISNSSPGKRSKDLGAIVLSKEIEIP